MTQHVRLRTWELLDSVFLSASGSDGLNIEMLHRWPRPGKGPAISCHFANGARHGRRIRDLPSAVAAVQTRSARSFRLMDTMNELQALAMLQWHALAGCAELWLLRPKEVAVSPFAPYFFNLFHTMYNGAGHIAP
eukprot:s6532_g4.t1